MDATRNAAECAGDEERKRYAEEELEEINKLLEEWTTRNAVNSS